MLSPRTQGSPGAQFDRKEPLCALVGSGISICAGMPGVCAMTDRIESDTEIYRHGGIYYLGREIDSNNQRSQQKLCKARELFRSVKLHLRDYFEKNMDRQPNYEDVYYLVEQMYDELLKDKENSVVTDWLSDRCGLGDLAPLSRAVDDNQDTVTECRNLIRDVVWQSLKRDIEHVGYLDNLLTALLSTVRLDLFSLNHDRVLDRYFAERELGYSDGFGQVENGVRYWNPCVFDRSKQSTRLYKLHGSIDWFRLRPENGQLETERVGIPVNGDFWHTCASDGRHQTPVDGRPAFLAGTFNKVTDYTDDVFIELHHRFMSRLRHSRFLVVCGYGFGDKGINGRILSWLMGRPDRTMIVIDGDPTVRERARRAVQKVWDDLCRLGRIRLMTSWVQDLDAKALAQLIR